MKLGYIRVSTILQNTARQLEGLKLDKEFIDKLSAKDTNRPQLQELISFAREGDEVFVHSIDRLSRNLADLKQLLDTFKKKQVIVHFVKENLTFNNTKNPMNDLLLSIIGSIAEFERELIKERQREGIELAKKKGKYAGRKKSLTEEQIEELKQKILNRFNKSVLAKEYGISRQTLYKYYKNRNT